MVMRSEGQGRMESTRKLTIFIRLWKIGLEKSRDGDHFASHSYSAYNFVRTMTQAVMTKLTKKYSRLSIKSKLPVSWTVEQRSLVV
jgi:hypothetical protein